MMRNPDAEHIDFGFMEGIVPDNPKWLGCNIDMCCERKGKFLFAEWKRPNEKIPYGQKILLQALSNNPNCFVIIVNGYSTKAETIINTIYKLNKGQPELVAKGLKGLQNLIKFFYKNLSLPD